MTLNPSIKLDRIETGFSAGVSLCEQAGEVQIVGIRESKWEC